MNHTDTHDADDTHDAAVVTIVTVHISLRAADGQPNSRAARRWLAAEIRDLTGLAVAGRPDADCLDGSEDDGEPAPYYEVTAIAFRQAGPEE
jgi:hypothetical protein